MKRVLFSLDYILIMGVMSSSGINLLGSRHAVARVVEAVGKERLSNVVESAIHHHLPPNHMQIKKPDMAVRTHIGSAEIEAALRHQHDVPIRPKSFHRPSLPYHSQSSAWLNKNQSVFVGWRHNLSENEQGHVKQIYGRMDEKSKKMFNGLSPVEQIKFMEVQLRLVTDHVPLVDVETNLFRPASRESQQSSSGILNSMLGKKSSVTGHAGAFGTVVQKPFWLSQQVAHSSDQSSLADLFSHSKVSRKERDTLDSLDFSKVINLKDQDLIVKKPQDSLALVAQHASSADLIQGVDKPTDILVPVKKKVPLSEGEVVAPLNLPQSIISKKEIIPFIKPASSVKFVPEQRSELSMLPNTTGPGRVDRHEIVRKHEVDLRPQDISAEDAQIAVQRIIEPRARMAQVELVVRHEIAEAQQMVRQELEGYVQKMIQDLYNGQQHQLLASELVLRDQLMALQDKDIEIVHDMLSKNTVSMREAESLMKERELQLFEMMKEVFTKKLKEFEASKAQLLTEVQEQRVREIEDKLQAKVREQFALKLKTIEELEEKHRSNIAMNSETTVEKLQAQMEQEHKKALALQKKREQQEYDDKQAQDKQKANHQEEGAQGSQEKVYKSSVNEFNRLRSVLLMILQELDQQRIHMVQAEVQSRELLAHAQSVFLLAVRYQAQTQEMQAEYAQKMQKMFDYESQRILNDIHVQHVKIAHEIDELRTEVHSESEADASFQPQITLQRTKASHDKTAREKLILATGKAQQSQGNAANNLQEKTDLLHKKEELEKFLQKLKKKIYELAETLQQNVSENDHVDEHRDQHKKHSHVHVHDNNNDFKKLKTKDPKNVVLGLVDSDVDEGIDQIGMRIAQEMFAAGEEIVTVHTIMPWIKKEREYLKLQLQDPRNVQYLAGYTQGCMEIIESSDEVLLPQVEEVREEGAEIAQELIDKNIRFISMLQLKNIVDLKTRLRLLDTKNSYAMNWALGYIQGSMLALRENDLNK